MAKLSAITTPSLTFDEGAAPSTPASGKVIVYAKTDGSLYQKDDAGTETGLAGGGAGPTYSDWTPALTATTTNPTLGSGATAAGRYFQDGKHVVADGRIIFGTSGVAAGSGVYRISLPVAAAGSHPRVYGYAYIYDDSTGALRTAVVGYVSTTTGQFLTTGSPVDPIAATVPWTWAANDALLFHLDYEAA